MLQRVASTIYLLDLTIEQWAVQLNRAQPLRPNKLVVMFTASARVRLDGEFFYDVEPVVGRLIMLKSGDWRFARLTPQIKYKKLSDLRVGKGVAGDSRVISLIDGIEEMMGQRKSLLEILKSLSTGLPGKLSAINAMCGKRSDKVIDLSERIKLDWSSDAKSAEANVRAKRRERYIKDKIKAKAAAPDASH